MISGTDTEQKMASRRSRRWLRRCSFSPCDGARFCRAATPRRCSWGGQMAVRKCFFLRSRVSAWRVLLAKKLQDFRERRRGSGANMPKEGGRAAGGGSATAAAAVALLGDDVFSLVFSRGLTAG
uniref:Uncharacterized protein n=1 Tax=Ananas comosus var. bracteatus TaxID=296719 RepID=A0A6V7QST7_ANACO